MSKKFNSVWDNIDILNSIPIEVITDINILSGASQEFIEEVAKLEAMSDLKERGVEAEKYLIENNGITYIAFPDLIKYLSDYNNCPISIWRQLYLLERSIPPRKGAIIKTWVERLKIFADTYILEHTVNGTILEGLPGKILFTRNSGDHENLHTGPGNYASDFYCWDNINNKRHAWVEFKHWGSTNIDNAKEYYKDKCYGSRYILVFLSDHTYKLIDYDTNIIIDQLELKSPTELLIW